MSRLDVRGGAPARACVSFGKRAAAHVKTRGSKPLSWRRMKMERQKDGEREGDGERGVAMQGGFGGVTVECSSFLNGVVKPLLTFPMSAPLHGLFWEADGRNHQPIYDFLI